MKRLPKISVVTIVFNDIAGLSSTMDSVFAQTYSNIEYIIIDGGSTDGSAELVRRRENKLDFWLSEPDSGIYDAINKGASYSTGDWLIFMNAGDDFVSPFVIEEIFGLESFDDADFIYGDRIVKYDGYEIFRPAGSTKDLWQGSQFSHQSVFIRGIYQRSHLYRLDNRISADFEMFFEAYVLGARFRKLDRSIARVSAGGLSDRARLENIAAFYKVVRRVQPGAKVHLYFICVLVMQSVKLSVKRLLPQRWIAHYRQAKGKPAGA